MSRTPSIVDNGAVIDRRQLAGERRGLDLDDVLAAVRDRNIDILRYADRNGAGFDDVAVAAHGHRGAGFLGALVLDLIRNGLRLADDAEARRGDQRDAAVALVLVAGDERMKGRGEAERAGILRHVVDAAVGDHDDAGDAVGRHVGERRAERGEQPRAVGLAIGLAGFDDAHVEAGNMAQPLDDRGARRFGLLRPVAEILARALVDHDHGDRS